MTGEEMGMAPFLPLIFTPPPKAKFAPIRMSSLQLASVHLRHNDSRNIHAIEAPYIDAPLLRSCARSAKGLNTASWTKIVLRSFRVPLIQRQVFKRREQSKIPIVHAL
jgi:hypothetical protein